MWSFVSTAASLDDSAQNPRGVRLAHVSLALLAISFCFVAARWYTRFFITRVIGSDDWVISVAFVSCRILGMHQFGTDVGFVGADNPVNDFILPW